tara:strand:- start:27 stop:1889 length:1863 start_codon:yes stop_codon:yes gene_type:complete
MANNVRLIGAHMDSTIIDGGGIGIVIDNSDETSHPTEISNLTIQNGFTTGKGGGISLKMIGELLLKNIKVDNNHAERGGGVYIEGEGSVSLLSTVVHIENSIISNNSANTYGGGIALSGDLISSIMRNVTVVNNSAVDGGGINSGSAGNYAIIANSIFWNNQPTNADGMIFPYYSNIDIPVGSNNIFADPLFIDDDNDFHLSIGSPCIDSGTDFLVVELSGQMLPGVPPDTVINLDNMSYFGIGPDMGTYESNYIEDYSGPIWHVATTGSDDTGDGSEQNPVATIEKASQLVSIFYDENYTNPLLDYTGQSTTDTIMVHDGTYYLGNLCSGDEYNTIVNIITSMNGPLSTSLLPINQYSGIGCTEAYYDISGFTISGLELFYYSSWLYFENCVITETSKIDGSSCGLSNNSCFGFQNTTFVNNNNWSNYDFNGAPYFINSIIFDNDNFLSEVINNDTSAISFTLNDMGLNSNGNFSDTDPLFCDPENGDFSLAENSPAVGAGENGINIGAFGIGCDAINLSLGKDILPLQYTLHQNYPNPFNPSTTLQYDLPNDEFVNITIYDMLGNVINNLVHDNQNSGYKSVEWNATNNQGQPVSAGVYLYSIEAGDFRQTKKMILLK